MKEHEIQWAVDELEIRNVIASLALVSDMGDIEEWGMLFTEDADYTIGGRPFEKGRAAIVESGRQRRSRLDQGIHRSKRAVFGCRGSLMTISILPASTTAPRYRTMIDFAM